MNFVSVTSDSPMATNLLGEIGRRIGEARKAGDGSIPLALSLEYLDGSIPTVVAEHLPRGPMGRAQVFAAHEKAFGLRPDAKASPEANGAWERAFNSSVTRLTRAGLMLTSDGKMAIPAGRTKNVGARGLGAAGEADSSGVELFGETFSRVDAAQLVKVLGHRWGSEDICDALRAHGYSFHEPTLTENEEKDGVIFSWKEIRDPKPRTPAEIAYERGVAQANAQIATLVESGILDATGAEKALAALIAKIQRPDVTPATTTASQAAPGGQQALPLAPQASKPQETPQSPVQAPGEGSHSPSGTETPPQATTSSVTKGGKKNKNK